MPKDEALDALLGKWEGITPAPDFNATVWRRLDAATSRKSGRGSVFMWVRGNVGPVDALTALGGVAAGLILSLQILNHEGNSPDAHLQLLQSSSLARGYVQLVSQGVK